MASDPSGTPLLQLPIVWVGADELPVQAANQLVAQIGAPEEIILTFGHVAPPVLLGSPDQVHAQLSQLSFVPVRPLARFSLTRDRLKEFADVLQKHIDTYDEHFGSKEG